MTPGQECSMFIMYLHEYITLNDSNLVVYALLRKAKYMITPVPNRGNQSFMYEPINRQLYEMTGKKQNILRCGTIKQFVVTNCSKERPGSIETKTLKNRILITIAKSKESHFNADFKYISFIKFSLTHQKLRA